MKVIVGYMYVGFYKRKARSPLKQKASNSLCANVFQSLCSHMQESLNKWLPLTSFVLANCKDNFSHLPAIERLFLRMMNWKQFNCRLVFFRVWIDAHHIVLEIN